MPALPPKQERFVAEYLIDLNASQAALRAGYSTRTAGQQAHELLKKPEIASAIQRAKVKRAKRVEITQDRVLRELAAVAFSNVADVIEVSDAGEVSVRNLAKLPQRTQRAIESIKQVKSERLAPDGGEPLQTVRLEIKMHGKNPALQRLCEHLGMLAPKKLEHTLEVRRYEEMTEAELEVEARTHAQKLLASE